MEQVEQVVDAVEAPLQISIEFVLWDLAKNHHVVAWVNWTDKRVMFLDEEEIPQVNPHMWVRAHSESVA